MGRLHAFLHRLLHHTQLLPVPEEGRGVSSSICREGVVVVVLDGIVYTPIAVDPSLIASREYSTWKRRPSGEKVLGVGG